MDLGIERIQNADLKSFKQKFNPVWSPQYVCTRGGFALPTVLLDITSLISGGRIGVLVR